MQRVLRAVRANAPHLADMREEHDEVALGFVPDHYLTEYHYPGNAEVDAVLSDVVGTRGGGPRGILARAMLLGGFRFGAVHVRAGIDPATTPVLALAGTTHLPESTQRALVHYLEAGGRLLLAGRVPARDMAGAPCTVLRDHLGLSPLGTVESSRSFFASVTARGWAAPRPETRVGWVQRYKVAVGDIVLRELSTGDGCGFDIPMGAGRAVVLSTDYECDLGLWQAAFAALGVEPGLRHSAAVPGIVLLTTVDDAGGRLLHALNVSGYDQRFSVTEAGGPLFGGEPLRLPGRRALMLPLGLTVGGMRIGYATAEVVSAVDGSVTFRAPSGEAVVSVEGEVVCPGAETLSRNGSTVLRIRGTGEFTVHRPLLAGDIPGQRT
jgi:beta-galactosidase